MKSTLQRFVLVTAMSLAAGLSTVDVHAGHTNIVFILVDDLGWTDAGCYGSTFYETPNIDQLASEGMRFTDAYAASPVCSPTRASIMTGKYPPRVGITQHGKTPLPLAEVTIAEALKEAGYATFFAGKWHLGDEAQYWPDQRGFDFNLGGNGSGSPGGFGGYFSPYDNPQLPDGPVGEYLTDRLADEAVAFIDSHQDQPFLVYLSHYGVHTPLQAKADLVEKYTDKLAQMPEPEGPTLREESPRAQTDLVQDNPAYAAMIESVDDSVGQIMDKLDELGIADRTAVIFMSDNGGLSTVVNSRVHDGQAGSTCNLPLRAGKGWLYEGGIREPMIIKWPGVTEPSSTCGVPVTSTDFYPTMLEMAGVPLKPAQHVDGVSLVPLLKGGTSLEREAIYWHYPHEHGSGSIPSSAVRAGDWKLIEWLDEQRVELFNLADDLSETQDLSTVNTDTTQELYDMLTSWREEVEADNRPNILWIFMEDLSPYIGCYGNEENANATPNIDALAASGVMFTRAYMPHPVCSPSRSALMTGAYATTYGYHNHRSNGPSVPGQGLTTVPQLFLAQGYETFNAGKTDYNFSDPARDAMYSHAVTNAGDRTRPWPKSVVAWRGIEDEPFFGQIQLGGGKVKLWDAQDEDPPPPNFEPCDPATVVPPAYLPNDEVFRTWHAQHCTTVRVTDEDTKTIMDQLTADGLLDKTIIFWFSDHGRIHDNRAKQFCTEAGTLVPLIITGPHEKLVPGTVRDDLVSLLDVSATTLALAGIPTPAYFDGQNLFADDFTPRDHVISARDKCDDTWDRIRAVRTDRYRYIRNFMTDRALMQYQYRYGTEYSQALLAGHAAKTLPPVTEEIFFGPRPDEELYDMLNDPHEINNLAANPLYAAELTRHREFLENWIAATDDQGQYTCLNADGSFRLTSVNDTQAAKEPPAAPVHLKLAAGSGTLALDWDDNTNWDLDHFLVYRKTGTNSYEQVGAPAASHFTDSGLTNGVLYTYYVKALDASGNESGSSHTVEGTPLEAGAPRAASMTALWEFEATGGPMVYDSVTFAPLNVLGEADLDVGGNFGSGIGFAPDSDGVSRLRTQSTVGPTQPAGDFTILMWIRPTAGDLDDAINANYLIDATDAISMPGATAGYRMPLVTASDTLRFQYRYGDDAGIGTVNHTRVITADTWHLLAVRFDTDGDVSLNVLAESDTVDAAFVASNKESTATLGPLDFDYADTSGDLGKTWVGARQGSDLDYDGLIDDLAYFDGLLTDAEIAGAFIGIYPTYDSDGDGIDDAWEFGYWGNLTNANHATAHDADPYSDLDEYIADTDPTNPNSSFRIERAKYRGGANIHFDSSTNRRYTLWFADSLFGSVWSNLPGQTRRPGLGPGDLMIDTNAVPRRYYRVEVSLP